MTNHPDHCPTQSDHLCMPEEARKRARHRLSIARGHLESIVKMLDAEDVYCVDVLRQIRAVGHSPARRTWCCVGIWKRMSPPLPSAGTRWKWWTN